MDTRIAKYNSEKLSAVGPNDEAVCRSCMFANPDVVYDGEIIAKGYKGSKCKKYPKGNKPVPILYNNASCEYYEKGEAG